jgi:hypothetical protein
VISEDAVARGYVCGCKHECTDLESYLAHFQLTAAEQAIFNLAAAVFGRPEIEGCMFCWKCEIKLHFIEKCHISGRDIGHQPVTLNG